MSINRQMAKGAAWMVGLRFFHRGVGFISTMILARLLVPADFGLVAMAMVLMHLLDAISDFSVHVRLIQKTQIDREDMDSAWSLQLLLGLAQAAILILLAEPAASFYNESRLVPIIHVLALIILLKGGRNIGVVMFQREMTFNKDFIMMAVQRLAMFVVTMTVAFVYQTYWALLAGMLIGTVAELLLSYVMHPHRPRWCRSRWGDIIRFSRWLLLNNFLKFMSQRGPELIIGRAMGTHALGLFSVGYEISMLPTTELVAPINRVALPAYSKMKESRALLVKGYLDVIGMISLIALPAGVGIAALSGVIVPVLLGDKWLDLIPVVHHLAIAGAIGALLTNTGSVFTALGKPQVTTAILATRVFLFIPGILFAAKEGSVVDIALVYLAVTCIMILVNLSLVLVELKVSAWLFIRVVYRPVGGVVLMYLALTMVFLPAFEGLAPIIVMLSGVAIGTLVYITVALLLWLVFGRPEGAESSLLELLRNVAVKLWRRLSSA